MTQVTSRSGTAGTDRDDGNQDQSWNLSLVGDWDSFTEQAVTETRTHSGVHELESITGGSIPGGLSYDAKGNLTNHSNGHDYTWDFDNSLSLANVVNGEPGVSGVHTNTYDPLGRRVSKTVNGDTLVFVHAGYRVLGEYLGGSSSDNPLRKYILATYIDEPIALIDRTEKGSLGASDEELFFYHSNHLYSVSALTDSSGGVQERYAYDAHGETLILHADGITLRPISIIENPYTFTGRRFDPEIQQFYYRARYYDPVLGRFLGRDPIGFDGHDLNLYRYVLGRPLSGTDPFGLDFWIEGAGGVGDSSPYHLSLAIGDPEGKYIQYSYRCIGCQYKTPEGEPYSLRVLAGLQGEIYHDECWGGEIVKGTYYKTSAKWDQEVIQILDQAVGKQANYRIANATCRTFTHTIHKALVKRLQATQPEASPSSDHPDRSSILGLTPGNKKSSGKVTTTGTAGREASLGLAGLLARFTPFKLVITTTATTHALVDPPRLPKVSNVSRQIGGGGAPLCFPAGTLVSTPGKLKPIEMLRPGDQVFGFDVTLTATRAATVLRTMTHKTNIIVRVETTKGSIKVTPEHPFFTKHEGWVRAKQLAPGFYLKSRTGSEVRVVNVIVEHGTFAVYNLTVGGVHNYFVGHQQILVHNK